MTDYVDNVVKSTVSSQFQKYSPREREHIEQLVKGALGAEDLQKALVQGLGTYRARVQEICEGLKRREEEFGLGVLAGLYEYQYDDME